MKKSVGKVLFDRILGIIILLLIVAGMNYVGRYVWNETYQSVVGFVNDNLVLLICLSVLFMLGELFALMVFPANIPYPLFEGAAGYLLVRFVFGAIEIFDRVIGENNMVKLRALEYLLAYVVLIVVIAVGYVRVVWSRHIYGEEDEKENVEKKPEKEKKIEKKQEKMTEKREITGEDVKKEFRAAAFEFASALRRLFSVKDKKKK